MRIFVYEHLTVHGIGRDPDSPDHGMYREGQAMRNAVVADLEAMADVAVVGPDDAEFGIVIAPETGGVLEERVQHFQATHRLIASSLSALALTGDKLALADHWQRYGVPTPFTASAADWPSTRVPAVLKPRDGAGSCETYLCADDATFRRRVIERMAAGPPMIAQDFAPGRPASVAFLVGPNQTLALPPTFQTLSTDGRFQYLGGELPIPQELAERATAIGTRAVESVTGLGGFVGVDLILGDAADGSGDRAIEINPRLTTSYVGLRALAGTNLAAAMLTAFEGGVVGFLPWKSGRIAFSPDGSIFLPSG
ncbi:ATP-grasp domain-containing protein [Limnoglobus roseus]|uniref:ATP-grasp domain-containing protein n=1 Tax=Limnoglobus roseus TaxID=2598579 RepID=A0A5C1AFT4_9BACT|nr:ATP-grasp domain-containing protein [Limnoglobus roseus]QEL18111.1 hypothetical protein PX52LOC_05125 [Limnoglobus roseus]